MSSLPMTYIEELIRTLDESVILTIMDQNLGIVDHRHRSKTFLGIHQSVHEGCHHGKAEEPNDNVVLGHV